jgi:hypothetical protein
MVIMKQKKKNDNMIKDMNNIKRKKMERNGGANEKEVKLIRQRRVNRSRREVTEWSASHPCHLHMGKWFPIYTEQMARCVWGLV